MEYSHKRSCSRYRGRRFCLFSQISLRKICSRSFYIAIVPPYRRAHRLDDDLDTDSAQGTSGLSDTGDASSEATDHNYDDVIEENAYSEPSNSGSAVDNDKDDFSAPSGSAFSATGQEEQSTLSDLPGMGNFLEDDEASQEDITSDEAASNSSFSVNGIETGGNDSKVMAQAIRTILATED